MTLLCCNLATIEVVMVLCPVTKVAKIENQTEVDNIITIPTSEISVNSVNMVANPSASIEMGLKWNRNLIRRGTILLPLFSLLIFVVPGVLGLKCYCDPNECDFIRPTDCPGKGIIRKDPCK